VQTLGGIYRNNRYVFNVTRYLQSIVTKGFPNYTLRVYAPFTTYPYYVLPNSDQVSRVYPLVVNTPVAKGRVVVYGGGAGSEKRLRLSIIYSRIKSDLSLPTKKIYPYYAIPVYFRECFRRSSR